MTISRQRKKKPILRGKYTRAEVERINSAYNKKFEEFMSYELEQLQTMRDSKVCKGAHLAALERAISEKEIQNLKPSKPKEDGKT